MTLGATAVAASEVEGLAKLIASYAGKNHWTMINLIGALHLILKGLCDEHGIKDLKQIDAEEYKRRQPRGN